MNETLYDYERQAWIVNGAYSDCNHPRSMPCYCYGRMHDREAVDPERLNRIRRENGPGFGHITP